MAQQQHQHTPTIGFKSIYLVKDQSLGIGSYGSVCKALCDNLLCAAKIIHPTLFDPNAHQQIDRQREHRLPISRFMQECELMSAIRHSNIVQFLGTHQDPQTDLPVLLMELMDDSLTHFLESSQDAVPYHIQVNFCHDIPLAIFYLHNNGFTHRDLSSNNVLLRGNVIAKVTDFGMAKLGDITPRATRVSFTLCPGTETYMPPEAVRENPVYTEKIDCFSIGTLIIQILTRFFPEPGDRLKTIQIDHPQYPSGRTVYEPVPEVERRQNHISLVDPNHPLLPIALECLNDSDVERPSAEELCYRVASLKDTLQFTESVRRAQERAEPAGNTTEREEELQQQVQDKDDIIQQKDDIIEQKDQQIQQLQQIIESQNNQHLQEKNQIINEKDDIIQAMIVSGQQECEQLTRTNLDQQRKLQQVTQQLESSEQVMAQFQKRIHELEQQLKTKSSTDHELGALQLMANRDSFTLRWREGKKAPRKMTRVSNAVVDDEMVYFSSGAQITAYNSRNESWEQLPDLPYSHCSLAVIRSSLTAIGGEGSGEKLTNKLFSLTGEGRSNRWNKLFPPMPTKRSHTIAVWTNQNLIVAGGIDQFLKISIATKTVEIMTIDTEQWSSVEDLPEPLYMGSGTICHKCLYIGGGMNDSEATKSIYTCTLVDYLKTCQSKSRGERVLTQSKSRGERVLSQSLSFNIEINPPKSTIWSYAGDLPCSSSTFVTIHDQLLAIGGGDHKDSGTTSGVYQYHPTSDTWDIISKMNTNRRQSFAAVLPTNELMVMGGYTTDSCDSETDSVEIGTVV